MPLLTFEFDQDFTTSENGEAEQLHNEPGPEITATNGDTENRYPRLHATWGQASATVSLLSTRYQNRWPGAIVSLHDHKGELQITWRDKQSRIMFEGIIMGAWEREGEHSGSHALAV